MPVEWTGSYSPIYEEPASSHSDVDENLECSARQIGRQARDKPDAWFLRTVNCDSLLSKLLYATIRNGPFPELISSGDGPFQIQWRVPN